MRKDLVPLSKFLSLLLRHKPEEIGLELDAEGWARINDILDKSRDPITREQIDEIVATNPKQRIAVSDDGTRIRARQGHSRQVDLGLAPIAPPERLYHGTARKNIGSIQTQGLVRGSRQHVHLSGDTDTARTVGGRHGKPVVLTVDAARMAAEGHVFYRSENGVWLSDHVPAEFLTLSEGAG
ncbi:RNA 2'-phosphotransferase [Aliiroseovarius sp.]|uniref:RNA 2'-phosphotransferase n=1 Tax=Aliiroseovarius sp. TaxID=1872442 RepID=UPI003BAB0163